MWVRLSGVNMLAQVLLDGTVVLLSADEGQVVVVPARYCHEALRLI